jgi:hypothetical protein
MRAVALAKSSGGGQAGLAMSEHLSANGVPAVIAPASTRAWVQTTFRPRKLLQTISSRQHWASCSLRIPPEHYGLQVHRSRQSSHAPFRLPGLRRPTCREHPTTTRHDRSHSRSRLVQTHDHDELRPLLGCGVATDGLLVAWADFEQKSQPRPAIGGSIADRRSSSRPRDGLRLGLGRQRSHLPIVA